MNFKDLITKIENKIGQSITRKEWTATLINITERHPRSIKVLVQFSKNDFSFERELKLVDQHFTEESKYNDEILRYLKRLNNYTEFVSEFIIAQPPNLNQRFKGFVISLEIINPIQSSFTIRFANSSMEFDKSYIISAETFESPQRFRDEILQKEDILNRPIDITYYQNLI